MKTALAFIVGASCVAAPVVSGAPQAAPSQSRPSPAVQQYCAVLDQYCVSCHNERLQTGDLRLDNLTLGNVAADAAVWEKVILKLRMGMMPPARATRAVRCRAAFLISRGAPPPRAAELTLSLGTSSYALGLA